MTNNSQELLLCGLNHFSQLGEKSNCRSGNGDFEVINPPVESSLPVSSLLSYSAYGFHSVAITKNGESFGVGNNLDGRIIGSLAKKVITKFTKFDIKDSQGKLLRPISAICCYDFTLYLISSSTKNLLAYSYSKIETDFPVILNTEDFNPIALFGGEYNAAVIDSDGAIIYIPYQLRNFTESKLKRIFLPGGGKAVKVACCTNSTLALDSNNKIFILENDLKFNVVEPFRMTKIVDICGTWNHCFVVSEEGKVFGNGSNEFGQLGLELKTREISEFTEIKSLSKYKIKTAYAGYDHSIFHTSDGKILACGSNHYKQFPNDVTTKLCFIPIELQIKKNVTFCIAGGNLSVLFIGDVPANCPNLKIGSNEVILAQQEPKTIPNSSTSSSSSFEISNLKKQLECAQNKIKEFEDLLSLQPNNNSKSNDLYFIDEDEEKEFHINEGKIGEGATSITYKVYNKKTKSPMCKKVIKYKNGQSTIKDVQRTMNEFQIMYFTSHPCICKALGINLSENIEIVVDGNKENVTTAALFLEYLKFNLSDVLKMKVDNTFKTKVALDIAHAMNFIHKRGMMHRDLKIENIMLNSFFETKLVDFGLVRISESVIDGYVEDSLTRGVGTLTYMSPEMANEEQYDNKTDVYSFGVVLHVIFTGNLPKQSLRDKISGKSITLPQHSNLISPFCIKLIEQCLSFTPSNRPSFEEILNQMRENSFELASGVDSLILSKRDKELIFIEKYK